MDAVERHHPYICRRENPSFSSTLLDKIYQSIGERDDEDESVVYRENMRKRQSVDSSLRRSGGAKNISEIVVGRKSVAGSSGSRYGLGFSSSDTETMYGFPARPRPIRTRTHNINECNTHEKQSNTYAQKHESGDLQQKAKCEGKLGKTKSGAMKIYSYLKRGKRPISPGGRLASFLISLFSSGNAKKSFCTGGDDEAIICANRELKSANASSMPSSASSISRSCLSKTPSSSSRGKLITDVKRSVRFYPGSVILGDGSDSIGEKLARNSVKEEVQKRLRERKFSVEETRRDLLRNYQKKVEYAFDSIKSNVIDNEEDYDEEDESASYSSSDLFELDHLSAIGIDRCMQELPLYETTSVVANRLLV